MLLALKVVHSSTLPRFYYFAFVCTINVMYMQIVITNILKQKLRDAL